MEVRHINRSSSATNQPKVDTRASTIMLCPSVSGSVSGVPDVSTRRRPLLPVGG